MVQQLPSTFLPASGQILMAGERPAAPQQPLALPAPPATASHSDRAPGQTLPVAAAGGVAAPAVATSAAPGSGGAVQRLQLDKLLSLLESGLPLGGDVKVRLMSARGLAGGADRHTQVYARLAVGAESMQSPPVVMTGGGGEPLWVWDHEETFEEVGWPGQGRGSASPGVMGGAPGRA